MALRGNLKDFSLPDVFQLVTLSRKTGILRIKRADGAEGSVWFREGDVFFAQSNWHHEPLGERLVSASKVTPSGLARALDVQKAEGSGGRRLGQILVDEGYITDKVLEAFVQEQIQDTIFDLFRWDEGDFDFDPLEGVPDEDIGLSVSIENIVMEGSRRLEEWNRIKKKIPSMEIVFKMATAPGEGTFEISLKPIEWNLLLLVDGTRSVSELAGDTNRTDFEVSRILYGLFSAGLLEVASDEEVEKLRGERARLEARAAELRAQAPAAVTPPPAAKKAAPKAETAPAAAPPTKAEEPEPEHEVPTFLRSQAETSPSAEDMAVFEEMMGAVLQAPEPARPATVEAPETVAEAEEPSAEAVAPEEPVAEAQEFEIPVIEEEEAVVGPDEEFEVSASDFFTPGEEVPAPPAEEEVGEFVIPAESVPEVPAPPAVEEDLYEEPRVAEPMSVAGLDTLSAPAVEPATVEPESEQPQPEPEQEQEQEVIEPEPELEPEPEPVIEPEPEPEPEMTIAEMEAAALESASVPVEEAGEVQVEIVPESLEEEAPETTWEPGEESEDLTELLSSLREEAGADAGAEAPDEGSFLETDLDLGDDLEQPQTTGVISTDAFLSDIDDLGGSAFSTGLGDELTALTGGGRARPNVVSTTPPAKSEHALQRDQLVDKDLVLKVIDGIKNL